MPGRTTRVEVDEQGHLILPPELMKRYGLVPGAQLLIEEHENRFSLTRSTDSLSKVYVEPTNLCNLGCRTCMRNVWDEPLGNMAMDTFAHILEGLKDFYPVPTLFLGGFGEPLAHPDILEMISSARNCGAEVEMITNGALLDEAAAQKIIKNRVNRVWVSIDGATPQSYADVRMGDALPQVIANLTRLRGLRDSSGSGYPHIGIAFVAMQRSITELSEVVALGKSLGADRFSISNLLPHTPELQEQILYRDLLSGGDLRVSPGAAMISLPRLDSDPQVIRQVSLLLKDHNRLQLAGQNLEMGANTCPFVAKGSLSIRWDGAVSPCLPLLHTHQAYPDQTLRSSQACSIGKIQERSLADIWHDPFYVRLRERLQTFDFSPCSFCNTCEMAESNLEDCFGNTQPACGGCLWAQGIIQCP